MEYQRAANREVNDLRTYLKDGDTGFAITVAVRLGYAVIFALLDIAQSIREQGRK